MRNETIRGITVKIGGDATELGKAITESQQKARRLQTELNQVNRALKLDPSNTTLLTQKQQLLAQQIENTKNKQNALNQMLTDVQSGKITLTDEEMRELERDIVTTNTKLQTLTKQMQQFGSVGAQQVAAVGEKVKTLGSNVSNIGQSLMPVSLALTAVGTASAKTTADFDAQMSKVRAISGATQEQFEALRDKAREMGSITKFSATESAEALQYMSMAGWDTQQMLDGLEGIMNLAAASGEDLATTSDIVTDALTAFGLEASDSSKFADILAATSANANTNVSYMGESFKYVAPVAAALGYSVEDTAEAIGLLGNAGIKGTQAGTSLRTIMNNLKNDFEVTTKSGQKFTIQTTDATGQQRDFNDILKDARAAFKNLTASEKANAAQSLVGKNAMSSFLALMNTSETDINKLNSAITNATGSAEDMADEMNNNLNGQITILKSAVQELAISIGDALTPIISKVVEAVQNLVTWFNGLSEDTKKVIATVGLVVAALGPVLLIVGKIMILIGQVMTYMPAIQGAITGITASLGLANVPLLAIVGTVTLVIAGLVGFIAILKNAYNTNEAFRQNVNNCFNAIRVTISSVMEFIKTIFTTVVNVCKALWGAFGDDITRICSASFNVVLLVITSVMNVIRAVIKTITALIKGDWEGVWHGVKSIVSSVWTGIKNIISTTIQSVLTIITSKVNIIKTTVTSVFNALKSAVSVIFNGIKTAITTPVEAARKTIDNIVKNIKNAFNFKWSLPELKIPKISVTGGKAPYGIGGLGSLPKFDIKWFKDGGILTKPTVFGSSGASLLAGGEAGAEAVLPIDVLKDYINEAVNGRNTTVEQKLDAVIEIINEYLPQQDNKIILDNREVGRLVKKYG